MRICHISDTHGTFPDLDNRFDIVVHSGDFFPNSYAIMRGDKVQEAVFQKLWLEENISKIQDMLGNKPMLFVLGNHDFIGPSIMEMILQSAGINAISISEKPVLFDQTYFYGFPYVPFINGGWNYEAHIPEMQIEVDKMASVINSNYIDVLVCHSAIHKCLDLSWGNESLGSTVIANMLDYKIDKDMMPSYYLHGHIHEASGVSYRKNMIVSNAATKQQIIEV